MNKTVESASAPAVRLSGVQMRYGDTPVLSGLDLEIARGKITVLLGPNGAGKTTTIRLMLGLLEPQAGSVALFGANPRAQAARRRVGVMMQIAKVPEAMTVAEHIDTFRAYYPKPLSRAELLAVAGLEGFERRLFGRLSGGEQQRVLFALALAGDPDLLFLDEPTVGMDVETRRAFWTGVRALRSRGKAVLLTTHYLEEADALADRIVVLGKTAGGGAIIADGTPAQIKQRASRRKVVCRTALSASALAALPHAEDVRLADGYASLTTGRLEETLRALLNADPALSDLEVTGAALEDAFVALTSSKETA